MEPPFAKPDHSVDPQPPNARERLLELTLVLIADRELEHVPMTASDQTGRQDQETSAQRAQGRGLPFAWQTQPTEPVDQVVGQQDQMEIDLVGLPGLRGNLGQGIGLLQFADVELDTRASGVKAPDALGAEPE